MKTIKEVKHIIGRISMKILGQEFRIRVDQDQVFRDSDGHGRVFIQAVYNAPCAKTGEPQEWKGRKFYLSEHMLEQEVIFSAYLAFKLAVEHEVMEGFRVDDITLVNPHVNYQRLLEISEDEVKRSQSPRVVDEDTGKFLMEQWLTNFKK